MSFTNKKIKKELVCVLFKNFKKKRWLCYLVSFVLFVALSTAISLLPLLISSLIVVVSFLLFITVDILQNKSNSIFSYIIFRFLNISEKILDNYWYFVCLISVVILSKLSPTQRDRFWIFFLFFAVICGCVIFGYYQIYSLKKELRHCKNCCNFNNPTSNLEKFFGTLISVENELKDLHFESDMARIQKNVWQNALDLLPPESLDLRKQFQDKIDECDKFIDVECDDQE